ncbi:JAB domain-containing protein [Wenyingzhuangia sp. IMCC45533]
MKVSEIQLSYSNKVTDEVYIKSQEDAYKCLVSHWDINTIELQEHAKVIYLNRANRVLGIQNLSTGSTTGTTIDIKLILATAIKSNASGIILAHNHPSGNLKPSKVDINITEKLAEASKLFDIKLLDHLIISKRAYYSLEAEGLC